MTVSVEMVLPGLVGVWLDGRFGTKVAFTLVGFAGGLTGAIWHLMAMIRQDDASRPNHDATSADKDGDRQ